MHLPVPYTADRERAERILLAAAEHHTVKTTELGAEALRELRRRYFVDSPEMKPRVYWQLTDNWLAMSVSVRDPRPGGAGDQGRDEPGDPERAHQGRDPGGVHDVRGDRAAAGAGQPGGTKPSAGPPKGVSRRSGATPPRSTGRR